MSSEQQQQQQSLQQQQQQQQQQLQQQSHTNKNIPPNNIQQQQSSSQYDQQLILQQLKQQITLTNHQLLQLTYNDQKFYQKLKQLNHFGCMYIKRMQLPQALVYLSEAQRVLEYAASCGKTIERKLIIATLNNQASLYQKAWELQKAESYLQAIIYNIQSFFQSNNSRGNNNYNNISSSINTQQQEQQYLSSSNQQIKSLTKLQQQQQFTQHILDTKSTEYQDYSIALWRKKSLVIFYLQYCAINSQNKNNQRAFQSAQKALGLIKEVCMDLYRYEKFVKSKNSRNNNKKNDNNQPNPITTLYQLATFSQYPTTTKPQHTFYQYYKSAIKHIAIYIKRLDSSTITNISTQNIMPQQSMRSYKQYFENYSIGTIMQINPLQLDEQVDRVDLQQQITLVQKHFKAIYLSVGHFILGTQARFMASQKYTLDENQRRLSPQFQQSQIYHLCSIIILTKYLLCESGYFDHIVNSFKNHYKVDLMEDAREYLERHADVGDWGDQQEQGDQQDEILNLFGKQLEQQQQAIIITPIKKPNNNNNKKSQNNLQNNHQHQHHHQHPQLQEVEEIQKLQSQIKTVNEIQCDEGYDNDNDGPLLMNINVQQQQSPQYNDDDGQAKRGNNIKEKHSGTITAKSTKVSKNTVSSHASGKEHKQYNHHHENYQANITNKEHHQMTATKKSQHKKSVNPIVNTNKNPPSSSRHQPQNKHLTTVSHHYHQQQRHKTIHLLTSREKQNKLTTTKPTQLNSNTKASRSKKKSDYQFLSNQKKIHIARSNEKILITQNSGKQRKQSKRETIYSKRQSDYVPNKISRSKSKNMRMPTSTQGNDNKKSMRRKDSYGDLRKTKKVQQQYGAPSATASNRYLDINKLQIKTSRNNLNANNMMAKDNVLKKSKNRKQSEEKFMKLTSPELKFKKLKSPSSRNVGKK